MPKPLPVGGIACLLLAALCAGCSFGGGRPGPTRSPYVGPLSESAFDSFASDAAELTVQTLRDGGYRLPVRIAPPAIRADAPRDRTAAGQLAQALVGGLNDRFGGAARFGSPPPGAPDLRSLVHIASEPGNADQRTVRFVLIDADRQRELLEVAREYVLEDRAPGPVLAGDAARGPEPREEIDIDDEQIGRNVLQNQPAYASLSIEGPDGAIVFLDRKTQGRFWVAAQRSGRTPDNRLRVELDIRSRGRERDARLRWVFFDARNRPVQASPIMPYRFLTHTAKTVVVTAKSPSAVRYVCLFERD